MVPTKHSGPNPTLFSSDPGTSREPRAPGRPSQCWSGTSMELLGPRSSWLHSAGQGPPGNSWAPGVPSSYYYQLVLAKDSQCSWPGTSREVMEARSSWLVLARDLSREPPGPGSSQLVQARDLQQLWMQQQQQLYLYQLQLQLYCCCSNSCSNYCCCGFCCLSLSVCINPRQAR